MVPSQRVLAAALARSARARGMMHNRVQGDVSPPDEPVEDSPPPDHTVSEREDFGMR